MNAPAGAVSPRDLPPKLRSGLRLAYVAILSFLTLFLGVLALYSLRWELFWDQGYYLYQGFLVNEHGYVLYRDLSDFNLPGATYFMALGARLIGYSSLAWRCLDVVWLAALLSVTWVMLAGFGRICAWTAAVCFGLLYLLQPESQLLQREYVMMLPIAGACALALSTRLAHRIHFRHLAIGVLFGLALTMKPPAILAFPVVLYFSHRRLCLVHEGLAASWKAKAAACLFGFLGLCLVWAPIFLWMVWVGSLSPFMDSVIYYWPIMGKYKLVHLSYITITSREKMWFTLGAFLEFRNLHRREVLMIPMLLYLMHQGRDARLTATQNLIVRMLQWCFLAHLFGVIAVGNFHPYNWIPALYFLVMLCAIALVRFSNTLRSGFGYFATATTLACLLFALTRARPESFIKQWRGLPPKTPLTDRVTDLEAVIRNYLRPGDKAQPLDFLGGTERVLLNLKIPLATPYLVDLPFYLSTQDPFVKGMQQDFLQRMRQEPPRFIIAVSRGRLFVYDPADDGIFRAEVEAFVVANYAVIWNGPGYQVLIRLEKNPDAQQ
ncbi:MAG: hypothetical protein KIS92_10975 [Planctomycetota bacterium]|nr:hypothetical protein [Planctomycetota bacterium]